MLLKESTFDNAMLLKQFVPWVFQDDRLMCTPDYRFRWYGWIIHKDCPCQRDTLKKNGHREGRKMRISSLRIIHVLLSFLFYQTLSLFLRSVSKSATQKNMCLSWLLPQNIMFQLGIRGKLKSSETSPPVLIWWFQIVL